MRLAVRLNKTENGAELYLVSSQRFAVVAAAAVIADLKVPDLFIEVQFGTSRQTLEEIASRFGDSDSAIVTIAELHTIYQLLKGLPDCFSSEESFYTRTGYFSEDFVGLSRGILDAVIRLTAVR